MCVDVAALKPRWRHIQTVLRPIFQLMRFYLRDSKVYAPLMRRFRPEVFPGILAAYARVFDLAMQEMLKRFEVQGSKGLGLALAEGVAALDRLGHYCFTGSPQVLMRSVLGPLKTMESLAQGGWPYLDPQLLDIRQDEGLLNIARWPRAADGRPIFMHVASLGFHYGAAVAASRQSVLWFRDLGRRSIGGSLTVTAFLEELFRELWVPQMVAFVRFQVLRQLSTAPTDEMLLSGELDNVEDDMERRQQQRDAVEAWAKADHPFAWSQYEPIWRMLALGAPRRWRRTNPGTTSRGRCTPAVGRTTARCGRRSRPSTRRGFRSCTPCSHSCRRHGSARTAGSRDSAPPWRITTSSVCLGQTDRASRPGVWCGWRGTR